jgi:two-component system cell cycle response regulator
MKKIVHLDNSDFFRKLVRTFLSEQGYLVESVSHGTEALEIINSGEVGMIITGFSFSDMNGSAFIKRVIGYPDTIPIIALTSDQSLETEHFLNELGVKARILKSGAWQEQLLPLVNQYFS